MDFHLFPRLKKTVDILPVIKEEAVTECPKNEATRAGLGRPTPSEAEGAGVFGEVYALDRRRVIKVGNTGEIFKASQTTEIRALKLLKCP